MSFSPGFAAVAGSVGLLAAVAAGLTYATVSDEAQWFGRMLIAPPRPEQMALTFDDGPNPEVTPRLLDLLARHGVRATFFLIGEHVRKQPGLTREIAAAGHAIGNHTMHHPWLPRHTARVIREELRTCSEALEQTLGQPVTLFRAPYGARRPAVLCAARELGLETVQWNVIVGDWKPIPAGEIHARIARGMARNQARGRGTNVVLHDGGQHMLTAERMSTVEAVRMLLEERGRELRFVVPPAWD